MSKEEVIYRLNRRHLLPIEVKKSLWAEMDGMQLSNNKHQHGRSILDKRAGIAPLIINVEKKHVRFPLPLFGPVFFFFTVLRSCALVVLLQLNTEGCSYHLNLDNPAPKLLNVCCQQIFQGREIFFGSVLRW